jgi:septal ring factor EnvC (AmiA/AmiB activator)
MTTDNQSTQVIFAQLTRAQPGLTDIDRDLMATFERLMLGRPEITDGTLTVTNICTESGVSRASYYRSPVAAAIKEILHAPQARRPELDELYQQVKRLKKTERDLRREHATEIRELTATIKTYANQIQALTLANAELHDGNHELGDRLHQLEPTVTPFISRASRPARHQR